MALRREPTARQMRLAGELRKLREAAGLTARAAAASLGISSAQISQIESGLTGVSEQRLRRMAANYSCLDDDLIDALVALATNRTRGWWEEYRGVLPASFLDLAELEQRALFLREVAMLYVPGLLQTEEYTRAVYSYRIPELPPDDMELRVQFRMRRKALLDEHPAIPYEGVIHEAALRIRVGDRACARAQLAHLLTVSENGNALVRVIPFELDGFAGATSTMKYAGGPVPQLDTVVRDAPHGTVFIDSSAQLCTFRRLFRRVETVALEPARSRDFIHKLAKEL